MAHSRRCFLQGGSSLAAALAVPGCARSDRRDSGVADTAGATGAVRSEEPEPWSPPSPVDRNVFPTGVQTGDPRPSAVVVSVWTTAPSVTLVVLKADGSSAWIEVERRAGLVPTGGVFQTDLSGLEPDSAYTVGFVDEAGGGWSRAARIRTAPAPDSLRIVQFGATSCLGGNAPWPTLTLAAEARLDFFAFLGDTVYADGSRSLEDYRVFWELARRTRGFEDVTASTSMVATWDDHEVGNNWSVEDVPEAQLAAALQAFRETMPQTTGGEGSTLWRRLGFGQTLDVFVLDCRGERADGRYLSVAQMDWLKAGLASSDARFKVILNSVPITDLSAIFGQGGQDDRWDGFPEQRTEILQFIEDAAVDGVLWVAGDVHYPQVGSVDPAGGIAERQTEVLAGPGGSFLNVGADLFQGDAQYAWMAAEWNYARFTCDPIAGTILVEHVADDGSLLNEVLLRP